MTLHLLVVGLSTLKDAEQFRTGSIIHESAKNTYLRVGQNVISTVAFLLRAYAHMNGLE